MLSYHALGNLPRKRHLQFRKPDGSLFYEEVFGTQGFSGVYSILYHHHMPPRVTRMEKLADLRREPWAPAEDVHRHHLFRTREAPQGGDPITGRQVVLYNQDVSIAIARPTEPMDYFYRNSDGDELIFIHQGRGRLETSFGHLAYVPGDYLVVPRGTTYRLAPEGGETRLLVVEARGGPVEVPRRYRNEHGQLLEHAPYWHRDIRRPQVLETHPEPGGSYQVRIKVGDALMGYWYDYHPFDVEGWDGYLYPWALSIHDFEPITGRLHQPPPVHQTFAGPNFVVCSFVPRRLDDHPQAVPIPYNHSNIDSDEVIYYVDGDFSSRPGVEPTAISLHPRGIPHGPQPGAVEAALGKQATSELAVMVDTFHPLTIAASAAQYDDPSYPYSWLR
ncbi:MAG: homogentisate 1,2-dioxygenase [Chloroflexi bacterium]|nr:homogentisate 1,2-dioxygenase [Chloroflexota bacterium]